QDLDEFRRGRCREQGLALLLGLGNPRQRADQDKIVVRQSLRNGYDKNQTSALALVVPWNSSAAATNGEGNLIDQSRAGVRNSDAVFDQGGVYLFAGQDLREKFCRLLHAPGFFKKTNDLA